MGRYMLAYTIRSMSSAVPYLAVALAALRLQSSTAVLVYPAYFKAHSTACKHAITIVGPAYAQVASLLRRTLVLMIGEWPVANHLSHPLFVIGICHCHSLPNVEVSDAA